MKGNTLATDVRGSYQQDTGWERKPTGKITQHRFYLGRDRLAALRRAEALETLWRAVERRWERRPDGNRPLWDDFSLAVGKAVSRGEDTATIEPPADLAAEPERLAVWFGQLVADFGGCGVRLTLPPSGDDGDLANELIMADAEGEQRADEQRRDYERRRPFIGKTTASGQTLHQALEAYADHVRGEYADGRGGITQYGNVVLKELGFLKRYATDCDLRSFDTAAIDGILRTIRQRPDGKKGKISQRYARNIIKRVRAFVRWLNKSTAFDWRRPADYEVTPQRIPETPAERSARLTPHQVDTYGVEQLGTLWTYATPPERALMALAMNCGFGAAEISTLQLAEIHGDQIKRVRYKSGVYGEWSLWPETTAAIAYVRSRRPRTDHTELFVGKSGRPLHEATSGGNRNQTIPNAWDRLSDRIRKDLPDFPKLSFNKLRKTAANLVKKASDHATATEFLAHGQPTDDPFLDDYTDRDFAKIKAATDQVYALLSPHFSAVADPFTETNTHPVMGIGRIRQMQSMAANGERPSVIARTLGVSRETVRRYTK